MSEVTTIGLDIAKLQKGRGSSTGEKPGFLTGRRIGNAAACHASSVQPTFHSSQAQTSVDRDHLSSDPVRSRVREMDNPARDVVG